MVLYFLVMVYLWFGRPNVLTKRLDHGKTKFKLLPKNWDAVLLLQVDRFRRSIYILK